MARTKQTARKSTGGPATRPWRRDEIMIWIPFSLPSGHDWADWLERNRERLQALRRETVGLEYVCAGRRIDCSEAAALIMLWSSTRGWGDFMQSAAFWGKLREVDVVDPLQAQVFVNGREPLEGMFGGNFQVSVAVLFVPHDEGQYYRSGEDKTILWNAWDGYISSLRQGIRRPPKIRLVELTWSQHLHGHLLYGFFRFPSDCLDIFVSRPSTGYRAWNNAVLNGFPEGTTSEMQTWEFFHPASTTDGDGNGSEAQDLRFPILANLCSRGGYRSSQWYEYGFNRLLAETLDETTGSTVEDCSSASAERVFCSPELLSLILINLSQKDLLLSQRVSRTWHSVISSTKQVQEKLFFRPRQKSLWRTIHGEYNPILYERFPGFFKQPESMISALSIWSDSHWFRTNAWQRPKLESAYRRPEASWRRMIPCNPAPTEYQFVYHHSSWGHDGAWKLKTLSTDHTISPSTAPFLTFGCLHDVLEQVWFQGRYFPLPNSISVYFGDLDYAAYNSDENSREGYRCESRRFADKCQQQFPAVRFEGATKVLIDFRHGQGCSGWSSRPDHSDPDHFHIETCREPQWNVELDAL